MGIAFDLEKETAKVKFILDKANIPNLTAEVLADLDVSGSTQSYYTNGTMQRALQRVVPIALNFDDNGELPVAVFSEGYATAKVPLTKSNYSDFVKRHILSDGDLPLWGGTDYQPVLRQNLLDLGFLRTSAAKTPVAEKKSFWKRLVSVGETFSTPIFFQKSFSGLPAIVNFFTDGENTDREVTEQLLEEASNNRCGAYFNFIGVGGEKFTFLKYIADKLPNVGFAQIADLDRTAGSDEIYKYLLPDELLGWLKEYVKG